MYTIGAQEIQAAISMRGPMSVDEYMREVLG